MDSPVNIDSSTVPLGIFCNMEYKPEKIKLEKGECFILYTDGLSEARGKDEEEYGEKRIMDLALNNFHSSAQDLVNCLTEDVNKFTGRSKRIDDLTVMVIKKL